MTGKSESPGSGQLVEQRLRLDEVARVEALGEPGVDGRQQRAGLGALALALPEPREARRGTQLEGLRLLCARDVERAAEECLGLRGCSRDRWRGAARPSAGSRPASQKCWPVSVATASPLSTVPRAAACWPAARWPSARAARNPGTPALVPGAGGQCEALCDLGQGVGTLTGVDPCEAVVDAAGPAPEREALDVAEGDHVRRALPLRPPVAPQLVHLGLHEQGERQAERFAERAGKRHALTGTAEGAVGMTQVPEVRRRDAEPSHTGVVG